jgi:hypothetical protein
VLAAVYLSGVSALMTWRVKGEKGAWLIAVACAALLPWIKQEGKILFPSLVFLAAVMHGWREWKRALLFAVPGVVDFGGWAVALRILTVTPETTFLPTNVPNLIAGLPRLGTIFARMGHHFSLRENWSVLWFVVPIALVSLAVQRRRETLWLALALFVPLLLDLVPFLLTNIDLGFHLTTSVDRLYLQISLVAVLTLGLALDGNGIKTRSAGPAGPGSANKLAAP